MSPHPHVLLQAPILCDQYAFLQPKSIEWIFITPFLGSRLSVGSSGVASSAVSCVQGTLNQGATQLPLNLFGGLALRTPCWTNFRAAGMGVMSLSFKGNSPTAAGILAERDGALASGSSSMMVKISRPPSQHSMPALSSSRWALLNVPIGPHIIGEQHGVRESSGPLALTRNLQHRLGFRQLRHQAMLLLLSYAPFVASSRISSEGC